MRTTFTTCISHPFSLSFSHCSHRARETLRSRCIYNTSHSSRIDTRHMHVCVSTRTCILRPYSGQRKFMRVSLSACFRRSELLGCMTLPLPLSQDKVNITKLRVYIRNVRSSGIRSRFASSVNRTS